MVLILGVLPLLVSEKGSVGESQLYTINYGLVFKQGYPPPFKFFNLPHLGVVDKYWGRSILGLIPLLVSEKGVIRGKSRSK